MRLEPLYRIRFTYPESWGITLNGGWQQLFFIAEGRCEGSVTGRFRGANFPQRQGAAGPCSTRRGPTCDDRPAHEADLAEAAGRPGALSSRRPIAGAGPTCRPSCLITSHTADRCAGAEPRHP